MTAHTRDISSTMSPLVPAITVTLLATLCAAGGGRHPSKCLPPMGKTPFDEDQFSGKWYVVGNLKSEHMPHYPAECTSVDYSVVKTGNITRVNLDFNMTTAEKETHFITTGQPLHPFTKSVLQSASAKWRGVLTQSVLATDYTSFALAYACMPVYVEPVDMFGKMEVVSIWSREPVMEATMLAVLKNVLSSYDFPVEKMIMNENASCK